MRVNGQWPVANVVFSLYIMYVRAVYRIHCQDVALAILVVTLALFKQLVRARIFSLGIHAWHAWASPGIVTVIEGGIIDLASI